MANSDLTGKRFGKLTVLKNIGLKKFRDRNRTFWLCRCDCGNLKEVEAYYLTSGKTVSCGCYSSERIKSYIFNGSNLAYLAKDTVGKANKSGVKGVTWDKSRNKWMAHIMVAKKRKQIGRFDTFEEAKEARKKAEDEFVKPLLEALTLL